MPTTGQMIKAMRMNRRYSVNVGADACMLSKRAYYDIEGGIVLPNEAKLQALANRYRCDIDDLKGQDWIPDDKRNRQSEAERKEKLFGVKSYKEIRSKSYREMRSKSVEEKKTILNGEDVTERNVSGEGGDVIKQLGERVKYLDGIIADKDETIRTLKAQLEFAEADAKADEGELVADLRKEIEGYQATVKETLKEILEVKKENARLKNALAKMMLKQIEEN